MLSVSLSFALIHFSSSKLRSWIALNAVHSLQFHLIIIHIVFDTCLKLNTNENVFLFHFFLRRKKFPFLGREPQAPVECAWYFFYLNWNNNFNNLIMVKKYSEFILSFSSFNFNLNKCQVMSVRHLHFMRKRRLINEQ